MVLDARRAGAYQSGMNRIQQLREERGISQAALAKMVGTSQPQIQRLENGERRLTEDWMKRIAAALDVEPADLLAVAARAEFRNEVEPYLPDAGDEISKPLDWRGLRFLKVVSHAVELTGIDAGKVILVDQSPAAIAARKSGDIVVLELAFPNGDKVRVIRQFLAPALLTTNRRSRNTSFSLGERDFDAKIVGILPVSEPPNEGRKGRFPPAV